jgi:hypothetical protein
MRCFLIAILCAYVPLPALGEELSDIDMQMIVELADGVWKGDVISVQEIEHRSSDGQPLPYRNVKVLILTPDGSHRAFRACKIEGDWRLDEEEIKHLDLLRKLDPKKVNWSRTR